MITRSSGTNLAVQSQKNLLYLRFSLVVVTDTTSLSRDYAVPDVTGSVMAPAMGPHTLSKHPYYPGGVFSHPNVYSSLGSGEHA